MKNIFRVLALVCCLALLAGAFAACTPGPSGTATAPTPTPTTTVEKEIAMKTGDVYRVLIWSNTVENQWVDGVSQGADSERIREDWLEFQDKYGVTVTYVAAPGDWIGGTMSSAASGEPLCDIFHMGGPFVIPIAIAYGGLAAGTYFTPLSDYSEYADFSDNGFWSQSAQDSIGYYNGKQYIAVPQETGWGSAALNQVCFFNKTLLSEGGHSAEEVYNLYKEGNWTFEKMREIAIDCTSADKGVYGLSVGQNGMSILAMIAANGGAVLTTNNDGIPEFTADSAKSLTAINFFLKLAKDDKAVLTETSVNGDEAQQFRNGTVAMMISYANRVESGAGATSGAIYQEEGLKYGVVLVPKGPDATDYISDVNWFTPLSALKGHQNPAGVVQCIQLYMGSEYTNTSVESLQKLEADAGSRFQDDESIQTLKDATTKTVVTSYMVFWSISANNVSLAGVTTYDLPKWLAGETTPESTYAANRDAVNDIIKTALGA